MRRRRRQADVAIVGAGLAGLSAATHLAKAGRSVIVLEARDRVGGRVETVESDGHAFDLGAGWVGATHHRMRQLIDELGLDTWTCASAGASVAYDNAKRRDSRRYSLRHPFAKFDYRRAAQRLDELASTIPSSNPADSSRAEILDTVTLEAWIAEATHFERARQTLAGTLTNIFSAEPHEISLLHALLYVRSNGGLPPMLATLGGAQERLVAGGAAQIPEGLAAPLEDALELGTPVRAVRREREEVHIEADGLIVEADAAIIAVSPYLAAEITYTPALDSRRLQTLGGVNRGDAVRAALVYESAFWRESGLSGETWGLELPWSFTHDVSPPGGRPGVLAVFFVGERARQIQSLASEERRKLTLDVLARSLGAEAAHPRAYLERDWGSEQWTYGGYCASLPPGIWSRHAADLREPFGRIVWSGTETATEHMGYMEGALQSGERAASEALALLRRPQGHHELNARPAERPEINAA